MYVLICLHTTILFIFQCFYCSATVSTSPGHSVLDLSVGLFVCAPVIICYTFVSVKSYKQIMGILPNLQLSAVGDKDELVKFLGQRSQQDLNTVK